MNTKSPTSFDIRDFTDQLTPAKDGKYVCPNCNEPKLGIAKTSGKYQCWNCQDTKAIARILTEPDREHKRWLKEQERQSKCKSPQQRQEEWVKDSAVDPELTRANLKQIDVTGAIAQLLNWNWYSHTGGWYVLTCDPITGKFDKAGQFKPDEPIKFPDSPDGQKYISFPKGGKTSAIYLVPTLCIWTAISERFGVPVQNSDIDESRDDLGFWKWVLDHPELPIVFVEGAKKAGCLLSHNWIAISLSGVWNGQEGKGKKLHPSIKSFIVPGRRVYLGFDADVIEKKSVEAALRQLGHLIKREKAEVFIVQWDLPLGKGCDDLIAAHGAEIWEEKIEAAVSYGEWLKFLQKPSSETKSQDVTFNLMDENEIPLALDEDNDAHPEKFYKPVCFQRKLDIDNCVTAQTFDGWVYRREFGASEGNWRVIDSAFYHWDETFGYWQHKEDNRINTLIAHAGEKAFKLTHTKKFGWLVSKPYETNAHKESAFKYCRSRLEHPDSITSNHLRAFRNCVVDMRTGQVMPHNKEYYLTSYIPYDYEPNKECPEVFRQFVADSFGEDMLPIIRAFTSMFLDPTAPYGRFPHLLGPSGCGKGTLGRFWNSMFGEDGANAGDFSNLATAEGRHQYLTGKSIFAIPDVGGYVSGLKAFYELIDNGSMSGRALFNPVGYSKIWNIRFWIASVDHLQIENAGDGWARRAYPIAGKSRTGKPDPNLRLKLEEVKADVISWALAMPREERDHILTSPPENDRAINLQLDAALYGDSTKSFVDLCLRPSPNAEIIPHHILHSWYVAYCKEHGYTPLGMSKFISHLKTVLARNFVERQWLPMVNGERDRVPAHWSYIAPVLGVFVSFNPNSERSDSRENLQAPQNQVWTCIKAKCEEGGLMDFEDFWNPPQPPDDDGHGGGGDNPPQPPTPPTPPVESVQPVQAVQGIRQTSESLDTSKIKGVQAVQAVQPRESINGEKINQRTEVQSASDFSLRSSRGGGQGWTGGQTAVLEPAFDFSDVIAQTNKEVKRLGWTPEQGKAYLLGTYGVRSRQLLTDTQLMEFLDYLKAQPNPQVEESLASEVVQIEEQLELISSEPVKAEVLELPAQQQSLVGRRVRIAQGMFTAYGEGIVQVDRGRGCIEVCMETGDRLGKIQIVDTNYTLLD